MKKWKLYVENMLTRQLFLRKRKKFLAIREVAQFETNGKQFDALDRTIASSCRQNIFSVPCYSKQCLIRLDKLKPFLHYFLPDLDECAEDLADCDSNSKCVNEPGGYSCTCKDGYDENSFSVCSGKEEFYQKFCWWWFENPRRTPRAAELELKCQAPVLQFRASNFFGSGSRKIWSIKKWLWLRLQKNWLRLQKNFGSGSRKICSGSRKILAPAPETFWLRLQKNFGSGSRKIGSGSRKIWSFKNWLPPRKLCLWNWNSNFRFRLHHVKYFGSGSSRPKLLWLRFRSPDRLDVRMVRRISQSWVRSGMRFHKLGKVFLCSEKLCWACESV